MCTLRTFWLLMSHTERLTFNQIHQNFQTLIITIVWKFREVMTCDYYSLTSISCILELFCFLTSVHFTFQLIRVGISDLGGPFEFLTQSFNPYCSVDYLLRGLQHCQYYYMFMLLCVCMFLWGHWLADFGVYRWKIRGIKISSLFNALLLWDISICGAILKWSGTTKAWCEKRKKQGKWGWDTGWAAGNTVIVCLMARICKEHRGDSVKSSPVFPGG